MQKFIYNGPVLQFDRCVESNWKGETYAESEKKARNNLAYQYKIRLGLEPRCKITLPGKIETVA